MTITNKFPAGLDLTPAYYNEHVGVPVIDSTTDLDSLTIPNTQAPNRFLGQAVLSKAQSYGSNGVFLYFPNTGTGAGVSGWKPVMPGAGAATSDRLDGRYEQTVAQSIPNATETAVSFGSTKYDSSNVFKGTGYFSVQYDGTYLVTASLRFLGNAGGGQRGLIMEVGQNPILSFAQGVGQSWQSNVGSSPVTLSCSAVVRLKWSDVLMIAAYQNCGAALNTDVGFGGTNHVSITWLRPL